MSNNIAADTVGQAVLLASRHPCRLRAPTFARNRSRQECRLKNPKPASARVPMRQAESLRHNDVCGADTPVCRVETRLDAPFPQLAAPRPLAVTFPVRPTA